MQQETDKRPLGSFLNIYIVLTFVFIAAVSISIVFDSFWLFIVTLIVLPLLLGVIKLLGLFTFVARPISTLKQLNQEVFKPIIKSRLILILLIISVLYFFVVRWYLQQ